MITLTKILQSFNAQETHLAFWCALVCATVTLGFMSNISLSLSTLFLKIKQRNDKMQ